MHYIVRIVNVIFIITIIADMTFEENLRIIELSAGDDEDARRVFTKLVCVYFDPSAALIDVCYSDNTLAINTPDTSNKTKQLQSSTGGTQLGNRTIENSLATS